MKKWIAAVLSAAMTAGTCTAVFAEADVSVPSWEEVMAGIETSAKKEMTVQVSASSGESISVSVESVSDEEGDASIFGSLYLPASLAAEETELESVEVFRLADGDLYVNVDVITELYRELMQNSSLASLLVMLGVTEPWIKVPALELPLEEPVEMREPSEGLSEAVQDFLAILTPQEMVEGSVRSLTLDLDRQQLIDVAAKFCAITDTYRNELNALYKSWLTAIGKVYDYKTIFADYIRAAAEGIHAAGPEISVEDAIAGIEMAIDAVMPKEVDKLPVNRIQIPENEGNQDYPAMIEKALDGADVSATCSVTASEESMQAAVTAQVSKGEDAIRISLSVSSEKNGEDTDVSAPQEAAVLTDMIRDITAIYYSQTQSETVTEQETVTE